MGKLSIKELADRYMKLYTGAVSDILDKHGYRNQALPNYIQGLTNDMKIAGPAFTGRGEAVTDPTNDDTLTRVKMLEDIYPHCVAVWSTGEHEEAAHWGEIMSVAARQKGCIGSVLDGGVRDIGYVLDMNFPVFAKHRSVCSSVGRWAIKEWEIPITIGQVEIKPGDFIFADIDGVLVIPKDLVEDLLVETEEIFATEAKMREELRKGVSVTEVQKKHGKF